MLDDTIAAIATPIGEGGLAVIRISGAQALAIADKCFAPVGNHSLKPSAARVAHDSFRPRPARWKTSMKFWSP